MSISTTLAKVAGAVRGKNRNRNFSFIPSFHQLVVASKRLLKHPKKIWLPRLSTHHYDDEGNIGWQDSGGDYFWIKPEAGGDE